MPAKQALPYEDRSVASLVEELVNILEAEEKVYRTMIEYGERKRDVLVAADVPGLEKVTALEQLKGDELVNLSNRQIQLLSDIATVLGMNQGKMTVSRLIGCLGSQPQVQEQLTVARDRLIEAADKMKSLNDENIILIQQAIELNEFDLTLFKSLRQAPETANYNKSASNTGSLLGSSDFDARQ